MPQKTIPKKVEKKIREYISVLKKDGLPIRHVFLFGSYAKKKQNKWSDIDICVISPKFNDPWDATHYLWQKRIFDPRYTIEPVGFSTKEFKEGSSFIHEIKKTGIAITLS